MTDPRPAILSTYPWLHADLHADNVVWFGDTWQLDASPDELWPLFHDTSRLNRALRLPKAEYSEEGGRRTGVTRYFRQTFAWNEPPWEWVHNRLLVCRKDFTKGPVSGVVAILTFDDIDGGTELSVWYGWMPRGLLGRVVAPRLTAYLETSFELLLPRVTKWLNGTRSWSTSPMQRRRTKVSDEAADQVERARTTLVRRGHTSDYVDILTEHLLHADALELDRVRPLQLAKDHAVPKDDMLELALDATDVGLIHARWDILCPHCRGVRTTVTSLDAVPERLSCEACEVAFSPSEQQLELTFRVHDSVRLIEPRVYCAAEAALKPHIVVQMKPDSDRDVELNMPSGDYVLRKADLSVHVPVRVEEGAQDTSDRTPIELPSEGKLVVKRHQVLTLPATESPWVFERTEPTASSIHAEDVLSRATYRKVMGTERLPTNLALEVGVQTLLFTDVVSSTAMYRELGDFEAFLAVRDHFAVVFDLVQNEGGVVIKTIGDAVMAAFTSPESAARSAKKIATADLGPIEVRVSLHSGRCLAVNLDRGVDYFGSVVNEAAKLQAAAGASEVAVSPELAERLDIEGECVDYTSGGEPRTAIVWSR